METLSPLGAQASSPAFSSSAPKANPWRSRGFLPHFEEPRLLQALTFRLHDAVPDLVVQDWRRELAWINHLSASDPRDVELRKRISRYEDAGHGSCWLRDERIASLVENTLLHFDGERYRLIAWCIMPNHVHGLIETWEGWTLAAVMHSWKSYTAHEANRILRRSGDFWFREYHDRFIRDDRHFASAVEYIEANPTKAGLAATKEAWRWSSAWRRAKNNEKEEAGGTPALPG
jgi:putative DNA methylase